MRDVIDRLTEAEHALDKLIDAVMERCAPWEIPNSLYSLYAAKCFIARSRWLVLDACKEPPPSRPK